MQRTSPPVWGPLLLALASFVAALAYVTGSVDVTRSEFTWPAGRSGVPAPLVLAAQSPETLQASGPCDEAGDLVDTGDPDRYALSLRSQDGFVYMTYVNALVGQPLPAGNACRFELDYDRVMNTATLTVGELQTTAELRAPVVGYDPATYEQFAVTRLFAGPGVTITLTTQPTSFSSSAWRAAWLIALGGAILALAVLLRARYPARWSTDSPPLWSAQDFMVAAVTFVAMVIVPPRFDDGWVLTTVRQYSELGFFSNYYSVDAVAQPQGFWWTWLERLWLSPLGTPGFLLRLPTALLLVGAWWLLRRHVLARLQLSNQALWGGAVVAATGAVGLQMTLRPEPMIALLLTATLATVVRYRVTQEPWLLVLLGGLCALALSLHQTGWSVAAASLTVLPDMLSWLRRSRAYVAVAAVLVTSVCSTVILLTLGSNWSLWRRSVAAFREDFSTYGQWLDEGRRVSALTERWDVPSVTFVAVGFMGLAALGFLLRSRSGDTVRDSAGWASIAALLGLILTSSKHLDHYGAVLPAGAVLCALAIETSRARVAIGGAAALLLLGVSAVTSPGVWALGLERSGNLALGPWRVVAALVVSIGAVLLIMRVRWRPLAGLVWTMSLVAAVAMVLSLAPVVVDGSRKPGSWLGQQLAVAQGRSCGLLDAVAVARPPRTVFTDAERGQGLQQTPVTPAPSAWARGSLFSPIVLSEVGGQRIQLPASPTVWSRVPLSTDPARLLWSDPAVSVATASRVPELSARSLVDGPGNWWVEPGLALQAPCVPAASIRGGVLQDVLHSVGLPAFSGRGLVANAPVTYAAGCADTATVGMSRCLLTLDPPIGLPPSQRELRETVQ